MKRISKQTKLFSATLMIMITSVFILPEYSCSQSKANTTIDGKKFSVISMETGKPETSEMEDMSFANGMFDDEGCHIWGFTAGKYTATKDGSNYNFTAMLSSPTEGQMTFKGMIMGDQVHGDMVWHKEGQNDINYSFSNANITMASLDGKTFTCQEKMGDSVMTEDISFHNGVFESPGCYQWGFSASPYKAWVSNGNIMWQSLYNSSNQGIMFFMGTVSGQNINCSEFWYKQGQDDETDIFSGMMK